MYLKKFKCVITGGSGLIGSHLLKELKNLRLKLIHLIQKCMIYQNLVKQKKV